MTVARRDIGDARGISSAGSGSNTVRDYLHRETSGNRTTVGSVAVDIRSVHRREGLRGGRSQERIMVELRGDRDTYSGELGGGAGSKE